MKPRTNRPPAGLEGVARLMLEGAGAAQEVADAYRGSATALLDADFAALSVANARFDAAIDAFNDTMKRLERDMPPMLAAVRANLAAGSGAP